MPLLKLTTNLKTLDKTNLSQRLSQEMSTLTGKPERYIMIIIDNTVDMYFDTSEDIVAYLDVKSIGSLNPGEISKRLCAVIEQETQIKPSRIYLNFEDIKPSMWGFNSSTFG